MTIPRTAQTALWWMRRGVGVVPLRSSLSPNGNGKLSPVPLIRWQQEGPLRDHRRILEFWSDAPEAQLAILLDNGLAAVDVDLKHLPGGVAPPEFPVPDGGGYLETTKSGGLHFVFLVKERLDPQRPTRVTGLGGYVDVFSGGLLVVTPSRFSNADRGYELLNPGIMVFPTMATALRSYSPWLPLVWESRTEAGGRARAPTVNTGVRLEPPSTREVDLKKVLGALRFLQDHPSVQSLFERGARYPDGGVDRSLTEFKLVSILKAEGFSREIAWDVVRLCRHTKSPQDVRGWNRFERHVWARLP